MHMHVNYLYSWPCVTKNCCTFKYLTMSHVYQKVLKMAIEKVSNELSTCVGYMYVYNVWMGIGDHG